MKFTILLILLLPLFVFAGERGFYVVAIDLNGGFWNTQYYKNYLDSDSEPAPCWKKRAGNGIAVFARKKIPIEITVDMVNSVVEGNKESISKMKKILRSYQGPKVGSGFDGLYAIDYKPGFISVYGFGARSGRMVVVRRKIKPPVVGDTTDILENIFCKAAAPFDDKFSP